MADDRLDDRTRGDIERLVRMESDIRSLDKQVQSLRTTRHDHGNWLQKVDLLSAQNAQTVSKLSEEVRHMDIAIEALSSKITDATQSLTHTISEIREALTAEKVKIALLMAGIGFATGIISAVATAVILSRMIQP
jgi:seryl-tRNA synthetase